MKHQHSISPPWKRLGPLLAALLLLAMATPQVQAAGKGHTGIGCRTCHNMHYPRGKHLWASQPPQKTARGTQLLAGEALCYSCHKDAAQAHFFEPGSSHPINVVPSPGVTVPKELGVTFVPGLGGVITCTSCHTPHGASPKLLKITDDQDKLCVACHRFR
jgi:predicted CXXCH cytochrome family protein